MEMSIDQIMLIVELAKKGKSIDLIEARLHYRFQDPLPRSRIEEILSSQKKHDRQTTRKAISMAKEMVRENPDIKARELKEHCGLSLTSCYKVLREYRSGIKKKRVNALPSPGVKFEPPTIPACLSWPRWLWDNDDAQAAAGTESIESEEVEVNVEIVNVDSDEPTKSDEDVYDFEKMQDQFE